MSNIFLLNKKNHFTCFRTVLALYLTYYFSSLLPYGVEMYTDLGNIAETKLNMGPQVLLDFLQYFFTEQSVFYVLISGIFLSILMFIGLNRRVVALLIYLINISLFLRNNTASDISNMYLNYMLLICIFTPQKDTFTFSFFKGFQWQSGEPIPREYYFFIWWTMAIGFFASGLIKLQNSMWQNGSALRYVLEGPLGKENFITEMILKTPYFLEITTFSLLTLELCGVLMFFNYKLRNIYVFVLMLGFICAYVCVQLHMLTLVVALFLFFLLDFQFQSDETAKAHH